MKQPLVILDNGHGNNTPGKRSPKFEDGHQIFEYELNRRLVYAISEKLKHKDLSHIILVPELYDTSLQERVNRVNSICKNKPEYNPVLISVHFNAFGTQWNNATGWEVWVSSAASNKSKTMASTIAYEMKRDCRMGYPLRTYTPSIPYKTANFYILRRTICPAVLTENGFMTNKSDVSFFNTADGMDVLADIHVKAIGKYFEINL